MGDADDTFVSLYRRFRPGRFSELRGQPNIVLALPGAVRDGHVSHAYLFSGPRGTGKTSAARILARALNCAAPVDGEPCGVCSSCLEIARGNSFDVFELDAASNSGVDAIRDLVAHAALGTPGRWKVYIVDEVHMLSNAAANALLKTLEEPPAHVVFVLATTDPQKVPATIRSRTQHFEFRLLGADTLSALLAEVRERAGLTVTDDDLAAAVRHGRGSAHDALSALDQVVATGSANELRPQLDELIVAICADDAHLVLVQSAVLHDAGWGPQQLALELVEELRQRFLVALAPELAAAAGDEQARMREQIERIGLPRLVRGLELLGRAQVDIRDAPDPRVVLDVALTRLTRPELDDAPAALAERLARLENAVPSGAPLAPATAAASGAGPGGEPLAPQADTSPGRMAARAAARAAATRSATAPASPAPAEPAAPRLTTATADEAGDPPPPLVSAERRPALGAFRQEASATPESFEEPSEEANDEIAPPAPATPEPPRPGPASAPPDRDSVVEAWGDRILLALPARAKALYSAGRFVDVVGGTATFALPNASHRDKALEVRQVVEQALATHFGCPVALELVVEAGGVADAVGAPAAVDGSSGSAGRGAGAWVEEEDFDVDDPGEAADESVAQARLLEAFPGAEEVSS